MKIQVQSPEFYYENYTYNLLARVVREANLNIAKQSVKNDELKKELEKKEQDFKKAESHFKSLLENHQNEPLLKMKRAEKNLKTLKKDLERLSNKHLKFEEELKLKKQRLENQSKALIKMRKDPSFFDLREALAFARLENRKDIIKNNDLRDILITREVNNYLLYTINKNNIKNYQIYILFDFLNNLYTLKKLTDENSHFFLKSDESFLGFDTNRWLIKSKWDKRADEKERLIIKGIYFNDSLRDESKRKNNDLAF